MQIPQIVRQLINLSDFNTLLYKPLTFICKTAIMSIQEKYKKNIRNGEKNMKRQFNEIYNYYAKKRADAVTEFMNYNGLWGEFKVSGYKRPTMFLKWVKGIEVYPDGTFEQCDDWIAPRFRKE